MTQAAVHAQRTAIFLLVALTAFAGLLRFAGLPNGLPQANDPDAVIVQQAIQLDRLPSERPRVMPAFYPLLLAHVVDALPGRLAVLAPKGATADEHLVAAANPEVMTRRVIALLALLAIPATFLLARRFLPPLWSVYAAGLLAVSLIHLTNSRLAKPHGALASFVVITLVAAMWLARRGTLGGCIATALGAALTVGCLHSGAAVLPAVFIAGLFAWRKAGRARLALIPALVFAGVWLFYPFLFDGNLWADRKFREDTFDGSGFPRLVKGLLGSDPTLALLLGLGLAYAMPRILSKWGSLASDRAADLCVVLAFVIPYTLAISAYYWSWPRFLMPLLPCAAVLAAFGTKRASEGLGSILPGGLARRAAPVVVTLAAAALPTYAATRWAWLNTLPHSTVVAGDWIRENALPRSDFIALSPLLYVPLFSDPSGLRDVPRYARAPLHRYQSQRPGMNYGGETFRLRPIIIPRKLGQPEVHERSRVATMIRERGARFAAVWIPGGDGAAEQTGMRAAIRDLDGELVFSTVPYRIAHLDWGFKEDMWLLPYEGLRTALRAERIGPAIEIYRLPVKERPRDSMGK